MTNQESLTGRICSGERGDRRARARPRNGRRVQARRRAGNQPAERQRRDPAGPLHLRHRRFRLRQVDAPRRHALQGAGAKALQRDRAPWPRTTRLEGLEHLDKVISIDQVADRPHAALEPRDLHRRLHAHPRPVRRAAGAQARGYKPGRFSFNVKGGRCEACQGDGVITIEMHFLPDVYVTCDVCKGKRYNRETLEVKYQRQDRSPTCSR